MNGSEHYLEAERLMEKAHDLMDQGHEARANFIMTRVAVHATLALAAATAGGRDICQKVYDGLDICISEYDKPHWSAILEPAVVGSTPEGQKDA